MRIKNILTAFLVISLVLSFYLASAKDVVFSQNFYKKEFSKDITDVDGAYEISKNITGFFNEKNGLPSLFNQKESSHMQDVKLLVNKGKCLLTFLMLSNIVLFSLLLFYSEKKSKDLSKLLIFSGALGLLLPLFFSIFRFGSLFEKFHLIFFPQGNWMFPADSLLIQIFTEQFFFDAFLAIIIKPAAICFFLIILGLLSSKVSSN